MSSEEVLRVGAGMAEPFDAVWCAIEYWESTGSILCMILEHVNVNSELHGRSLLCHAILCNNDEAAEILLRRGANIEFCVRTTDGAEFLPIHLASKRGLLHVLKVLITHKCNLDAQTEKGETPLMLCIIHDHQECFLELINSGADLAARDKDGNTVMEIAKQTGKTAFVYQTVCNVILSGRKLYSSDLQTFSPLHYAAHHGNAEVIRELLKRKEADIDQQDKTGLTAAMIAAQGGQIEAFKVLVFLGANISVKNMEGGDTMKLAEQAGYKDQCEEVLCNAIMAGVLKGADFQEIHFAARKGNCELLDHLLEHGHSVNSLDKYGSTPLMITVREGYPDACKLLLTRGADCHISNTAGETALSLAQKVASKMVEGIILDHIARKVVLTGAQLLKHTKQGKGAPHLKSVKLLSSGVISWGGSKKRNLLCIEACIGASQEFLNNRKNQDAGKNELNLFRVATKNGKEIHFDAAANFSAELWTRGINLLVKETLGSS
ncbi:hypothetical protein KP509_14G021900 [Ceratopteris richardii]|nr:hypothetical protein KP509_14G021900 [Ceratopteris richardii]